MKRTRERIMWLCCRHVPFSLSWWIGVVGRKNERTQNTGAHDGQTAKRSMVLCGTRLWNRARETIEANVDREF